MWFQRSKYSIQGFLYLVELHKSRQEIGESLHLQYFLEKTLLLLSDYNKHRIDLPNCTEVTFKTRLLNMDSLFFTTVILVEVY